MKLEKKINEIFWYFINQNLFLQQRKITCIVDDNNG